MLKLYNTLTRQKENFTPIHANKVGLYTCGITVYDYCHIGHARTQVSTDVIVCYLRYLGYQVRFVRNITDIDDKIIKRANDNNESYQSLTSRFIEAMHHDFDQLLLTKPDDEPRATEYIPQMITLIEKILKNKHGYIAKNGDVYFDVRSFKSYGGLSHHNIDQLESGIRVEVSEAKKDALDFVLWKLAKPGEPNWDSPWGKGRPGWHLECSAMSMTLLGEQFDIHIGGRDLIFPHHENEIAQSEGASHKKFVNYWLHGGFLQIEKEKMSKSLGNFITIKEVLKEHDAEVLRYLFIASHYRSPLIYSPELLIQAKQSLVRLYNALRHLPVAEPMVGSDYEERFKAAMDDDLNAPIALSVLFDLAHEIQRIKQNDPLKAAQYGALLRKLANIFSLLQQDPEVFLQSGVDVDADKINQLIEARNKARREKNWQEADKIRDQLSAMSIMIEDTANGTVWKKG